MMRPLPFLAAGLLLATAATAQDQTAQDQNAPQPSAVRANNDAAAATAAQTSAQTDAQAQYQADLAAYDAALVRHDASADRQADHYHHQQRAYADAMQAWRAQDYACRHGSSRACNTPAPDPANYW